MARRLLRGALGVALAVSLLVNGFFWFTRRHWPAAEAEAAGAGKPPIAAAKAGKAPAISEKAAVVSGAGDRERRALRLRSVEYDGRRNSVEVVFGGYGPLDLGSLLEHLSVEPPLKLHLERLRWDDAGAAILGDFVSGRDYVFHLRRGVRDQGGAELMRDLVFTQRIGDRTPLGRFRTSGLYFPLRDERWVVPVELVNVGKLAVNLSRFYDSNLVPFPVEDRRSPRYLEDVLTWRTEFSRPRNKPFLHPLDLRGLQPRWRPGAYQVELYELDGGSAPSFLDRRTFFVTDLGIAAAEDRRQARIGFFVRRLSDGQAVPGARASLYSRRKQLLGTVRTDSEGRGTFGEEACAIGAKGAPGMILVTAGEDVNVITLGHDGDAHSLAEFPGSGDPPLPYDETSAFLYTERGIYRNDETVHFRGLVRSHRKGVSAVLRNAPAELVLCDPSGNVLWKRRVESDGHGAIAGEFRLPPGALAGYYALTCGLGREDRDCLDPEWGGCRFRVGDFVPDRISVGLKAGRRTLAPGETMEWRTSARYYFGTPVAACSATFAVKATEPVLPEHWHGYTVGDAGNFEPRLLDRQVDEDYRDGAPFRYTYTGGFPQPVRLTAVLSVAEPGGRSVSAAAAAVQLATPDYLGLKYEKDPAGAGDPLISCAFLNYDKDEKRALSDETIDFELHCLEWQYVLRRKGETLRRDWELMRLPRPKPAPLRLSSGTRSFRLEGLAGGLYELQARTPRHATVLRFWHDSGAGGVRSRNPNVLVLSTDRREYLPGDRAEVGFDSPEEGHVLVFCGGQGLDRTEARMVRPGRNTLSIPIPAGIETGRYFCGVTLVHGRGGRHRLFSLLGLPVSQEGRRLAVDLRLPTEARPGATVDLEVSLRNGRGAPESGHVQVFAVDEGILALTDHETPDPFRFFFGDFQCGMSFYDTYGKLYPEVLLKGGDRIGGDRAWRRRIRRLKGGLDRRRDRSAVVMLPGRYIEAGRPERFRVALPKHTGTLRFMAVAMGERSAGSQERRLVLKDPATILASLPARLVPGDEFELVLQAFNHNLPPGRFRLELDLPPGIASRDALQRDVDLRKGETRSIPFRCRAVKAAGDQTVGFRLRRDGLVVGGETHLRIDEPAVPETRSALWILPPGNVLELPGEDPEDGAAPLASRLQIMPSPLTGVREALDWLNGYPYRCLEQITAGAFPWLAAAKLRKAGLISEAEEKNLDDRIRLAANEILSRRLSVEGFAGWPGGQEPWRDAGVFAAHFLFLADRNGFLDLDRNIAREIGVFLRNVTESSDTGRTMRAYALYVLAVEGFKGFRIQTDALALLQHAPDFAGLLAAAALFKGGHAREAKEALDECLTAKVWLNDRLPFAFAGRACRYGMALAVLAEILPDDPRLLEVVQGLMEAYSGDGKGWGDTHENAWACYGLAQAAGLLGSGSGKPPEAVLEFADGAAATWRQAGPATLEDRLPVRVRNTGGAPLYLLRSVVGRPEDALRPVQDRGLRIERVYLDADGRPVASAAHGDLLTVRIRLETGETIRDFVLADLFPGGLAVEDQRFASRAIALTEPVSREYPGLEPRYVEQKEDRLLLFGTLEGGFPVEFSYRLRAVARGRFRPRPCQGESMYGPRIFGQCLQKEDFEIR